MPGSALETPTLNASASEDPVTSVNKKTAFQASGLLPPAAGLSAAWVCPAELDTWSRAGVDNIASTASSAAQQQPVCQCAGVWRGSVLGPLPACKHATLQL